MSARFCCDNLCAQGRSCPAHEEDQEVACPRWAAHAASEIDDDPPPSYSARTWIGAIAAAATSTLVLVLITRGG